MTDKISSACRSENMRRIKAKETKPELAVRALLRELGVRYRLHAKDLPGKPDIVRRKDKRAVFVHGCFWHMHPRFDCLDSRLPKSNTRYWIAKLQRNAARDQEHLGELKALDWRVLTIWDCELKHPSRVRTRLKTFFRHSAGDPSRSR